MENEKALQGFKWALGSLVHSRRAKYVSTGFFSDIMRRLQISRSHTICSIIKSRLWESGWWREGKIVHGDEWEDILLGKGGGLEGRYRGDLGYREGNSCERRLKDVPHDSIQWSTLLDESLKSLGTILCAVGAMSQNLWYNVRKEESCWRVVRTRM